MAGAGHVPVGAAADEPAVLQPVRRRAATAPVWTLNHSDLNGVARGA
jgi:hypothetical protein